MNEARKIAEAIRKGRANYPGIRQTKNAFFKASTNRTYDAPPDDPKACGIGEACALGFAMLGGINRHDDEISGRIGSNVVELNDEAGWDLDQILNWLDNGASAEAFEQAFIQGMNPMQAQVAAFRQATGGPFVEYPQPNAAKLRLDLMLEELKEIGEALGYSLAPNEAGDSIEWYLVQPWHTDLLEAIDGIADLLYVTFGTADAFGIDIEPFFDEVQRSNMSKIPDDGIVVKRADGKILKPPTYSPPNLGPILQQQLQEAYELLEDVA